MTNLPKEFVERMRWQLGDEADAFFDSLSEPSPTSIRLHHSKGKAEFEPTEKVPWCDHGHYLPVRPQFHLDPHWHGGAYYVQEASSMILDFVIDTIIKDSLPRIWLDMCAAPGGKTGIIAKHMNNSDVLVANEVVPQRRSILKENLIKGGYMNTFITGEQAATFTEPFADVILVDAPCAGEGMMRKEPEAIRQWNPRLVRDCSLLQNRIVTDAIKALLPGGHLIYSTCSYSHEENIDNVKSFADSSGMESVQLAFPNEWNIVTIEKNNICGYQLYPHKIRGEGLFVAVLRNEASNPLSKKKSRSSNEFISIPPWLQPHIQNSAGLKLCKSAQDNSVITEESESKALEVVNRFPKAELITGAGELKGKDFIPGHFLAMSGLQDPHFNSVDLNLAHSLDYLERNTQSFPSVSEDGWYLVQYHGTTLGWAKKTVQGWKNHYPIAWKLRSRKMS